MLKFTKMKKFSLSLIFAVFLLAFSNQKVFAGEFSWTGGGDGTTWNAAGNWNLDSGIDNGTNGYPDGTDNATIGATVTIIGTIGCTDLTVSSGFTVTFGASGSFTGNVSGTGTISIGAYTLGVNGNLTITTLTCTAAAAINVGGNWSVSNFTASSSTVDFNGTGAQSLSTTTTFWLLISSKTGGTLTISASSIQTNRDFSLTGSGGTVDASSCNITVRRNFIRSNGTFTSSNSTLIFDSQTFNSEIRSNANITFNNITYSQNNGDGVYLTMTNTGSGARVYTINGTFKKSGNAQLDLTNGTGTGTSITYGTSSLLEYAITTNATDEWSSSGVPNVKLQTGTVTIPSAKTGTVNTKLTRTNGSLTVTGTLAYGTDATLEYNGSSAQTVGNEWTTSLNPDNITINNSSGVTISSGNRDIDSTLTLTQGELKHSGTLTVDGDVIGGSGTYGQTDNGTLILNGGNSSNVSVTNTLSLHNLTINKTSGSTVTVNIESGASITTDASATLRIQQGTLSFSTSSQLTLGSTNTLQIDANGIIETGGTDITGFNTYTLAAGSDVRFTGGNTETVPNASYGNLTVNKSAGDANFTSSGVTLNKGSGTENSTLRVQSGTLNLCAGAITTAGTSTGSFILQVDNGTTLRTSNASGTASGTAITGFNTYTFGSTSTVIYNGSGSAETIAGGSAAVSYGNLTLDNSSNFSALSSTNKISVSGTAAFNDGTVQTTSGDQFVLLPGVSVTGADVTSYINGPVNKQYNGSTLGNVSTGTGLIPVGKTGVYRPVKLSFASIGSGTVTMTVEQFNADANPNPDPPTGFNTFYDGRYWNIAQSGGGTIGNATLVLDYNGFTPNDADNVQIVNGSNGGAFSLTGAYVSRSGTEVTHNSIAVATFSNTRFAFAENTATRYWVTDGSGDWDTGSNWTGGIVPAAGDIVILNHSGLTNNYTVTLSVSASISDLTIQPTATSRTITLQITSGGALTLSGSGEALTVEDRGALTINGPTGAGVTLSNGSSTFDFKNGSYYNLSTGTGISGHTSARSTFGTTSTTSISSTNASALVADTYGILNISNASGTLTVSGSVNSQNFTMSGAGGVSITGGLTITGNLSKSANGTLLVNGGTLSTSGSLTVATGGTVYSDGTNGRMSIGTTTNNTGTIDLDGTGNSTFTGAFTNNSGGNVVIHSNAGMTTFSNTMNNNGTLTPTGSGAGLVTFTGAYTGTGSISASSTGPAVTFSSTFTPSGSGTLTFGSQALTFDGDVTLDGGTLTPSSNTSFKGAILTVNSGSISSSAGTLKFERTSGAQSVANGTGSVTFSGLTINNSSGVTLNDPVSAAGTFTLTSGLLTTTTTNLLTITGSVSGGSSSSYVNGPMSHTGTGTKVYPIGRSGDYRPVELLSVSGSSPVVRFEMFASDPGGSAGTGLNNISVVRYWQGSLTSGSLTSAQVKLYWGADDGVDGALTDLRVAACGTVSGAYADSGRAATTGNGTWGSITSLSVDEIQLYFTLGSASGDNSLPVELSSFVASPQFGSVNLEWVTQSEINNQGFNIYRKDIDEDSEWSAINSTLIPGKGSYSNESVYNYVDKNVAGGHTYQYKLESVSISGIRVEEKIVEAVVPVPNEYVVFKNYPNPFNPATKIKFQLPEAQNVKLTIYDMRGSKIRTLVNNSYPAGEHVVSWDATDNNGNRVASGLYVYRFEAGRFSKINKMILLK